MADPPSGLIEGHAGQIGIQQLFVGIGKSTVLLEPAGLPLLHLELFGMHVGYICVGGGGCGPGEELFSVLIDPETQTDQNPAVTFALGHGDIFVGTLFNIFAVQRQNPSAPRTNRMKRRFALQRLADRIEGFARRFLPGVFAGMDQLARLLGIVQDGIGIREGFEDQGRIPGVVECVVEGHGFLGPDAHQVHGGLQAGAVFQMVHLAEELLNVAQGRNSGTGR